MSNVWSIVILCIGILYFLSPIDFVPDFVPILGWLEDLVVVAVALWLANRTRTATPEEGTSEPHEDPKYAEAERDARRGRATESPAKTPWQLLDVEPDADDDAIEAAYKAQLMQYHPDRAAHLGEDLRRLAHEKTLEIQRAYEQIKRQRAS